MKKMIWAAAAVTLLSVQPALAGKAPKMTPLQIQELQSHELEVAKNVAFSSVMTVLQDSGYRINAADRETGLITASASTKTNTTWMPFIGFGKSKKTPVVSAYIEDISPVRTRIRLNFVMTKMSANQFGGGADEEPILEATVYRDAFEKIDQQVFIRSASAAPAPEASPVLPGQAVEIEAATPALTKTAAVTKD